MSTGRIGLFFVLTLGLAASDLRAQQPRGSDFRISPRASERSAFPDVATAADGSFVVVWQELGQEATEPGFVRARLFDAAGRPRSGPIVVARIYPQFIEKPSVAIAPDGRFVVVWQGGVENPYLVFGRRFDAAGRPLGPRFRLTNTALAQYEPDVAMASDGSFVTVWYQPGGDVTAGPTTTVVFRLFDAAGRPRRRALVAIDGSEEQQSIPRVALRPDGGFVVVCQAWKENSSFYDIKARLFSASGAPLGGAFLVNGDSAFPEDQLEPAVAVAADGKFAVAWTDRGADLGRHHEDGVGVAARFYAADATPLGPSLLLNTFLPGAQEKPAISALPNHGFLVLWASGGDLGGDGRGIFARELGPDGMPRGEEEFSISPGRVGSPDVSVAPNGRGIAVWTRSDDEETAIIGRRLAQRK
jgi:hypothetical protein